MLCVADVKEKEAKEGSEEEEEGEETEEVIIPNCLFFSEIAVN